MRRLAATARSLAPVNSPPVLVLIFALAACSRIPPVAISDVCMPLTDAALLAPLGADIDFSVGVVEHQTLLERVLATNVDPMHHTATVTARWFDRAMSPTTASFSLGVGVAEVNAQWVAFAGRVYGQVWTVSSGDPYATPLRLHVGFDALTPGTTAIERTSLMLPIFSGWDLMGDLSPVTIGAGSAIGSAAFTVDRSATAAVGHRGAVFAVNAMPSDCPGSIGLGTTRVMLFDGTSEFTDELGDPNCAGDVAHVTEFEAYDEVLVSLAGGLGLFYRNGISGGVTTGRLHYVRVGADLHVLDDPPIDVDDQVVNREYLFPSGYQTHAAQVEGGPILYLTRSNADDIDVCSNLRLVDPNGANPRYAAWQLPCYVSLDDIRRNPPAVAPWMSTFVHVEPLASGRAALVYNQRTRYALGAEYVTRVTSSTDWDEGVFLATVNALGQRTSEIVRVTPPQTTALDVVTTRRSATDGPFPHEIPIASASEGNEIVIAWLDSRPDAPGYYARRYACGPIHP